MKKFLKATLIFIVVLITLNIGPVWLQRLIGFNGHSDRVYYPQWINDEEYCYLRVESFFDYGMGFSGISKDFFHPLKFFRGSNATFYIYRANINNPAKERLIRKITMKVDFVTAPEEWKLINRGKFTFRRLDNGELLLLVRGRVKYIAYYMNTEGRILKKQVVGYSNIFGSESIVDVSPDGERFLVYGHGIYIKNVASGQEFLLKDRSPGKWISRNMFIDYKYFPIDIKESWKDTKCEVYIMDDRKEEVNLVYFDVFKARDEVRLFLLDAALSTDSHLLFLSNIGIFKKEGKEWQMIKDLKDMKFNLYYPDISPDSQKIVGVETGMRLKVLELKELLE